MFERDFATKVMNQKQKNQKQTIPNVNGLKLKLVTEWRHAHTGQQGNLL